MALSFFDLFSIGLGPSSSHTVGPMRAAHKWAERLLAEGLLDTVARIHVDLWGSLGSTGAGHHTDRATVLGLMGNEPETIDPRAVAPKLDVVKSTGRLSILGTHEIDFDWVEDLTLHMFDALPQHPNGMTIKAFDASGEVVYENTQFSIGGGFILDAADMVVDDQSAEEKSVGMDAPHEFRTAKQLLAMCDEQGKSIDQLVLENELTWRSQEELESGVMAIWGVMQECVQNGLHTQGRLPGGLNVLRRAPLLRNRLSSQDAHDPLAAMDWISLYAMAVNEENAAGGRVVTAPTNGAAGVIPAVLHYYRFHMSGANDEGVMRFLLTAGAFGAIIKMNASISGAEVGCQGEVGSACAMAAAGLAAALGGSAAQIENAGEIAMEHNLGLTCDPVGGLVQVPCIERNAIGAVKAVAAARSALHGDGKHIVSFDTAVRTMRDTGRDMQTKYKETSQGGLAVNVIEC
ncbi:L-serine ammonia-lyase [Dermatophilus congolensis]|uniref:L-serine dehydratase n=1 Tax=Dermatophilus congolensis TaxID=1863 RepID=A0A239V604_9MICO|nr:L-serine ammonia-lyase [Dermatophilus congolensis]MBO3130135.1 L-serine ammonia-lyase [Dermatophilus congolensis]MBO3131238.1 L-serine ammonia-lyase [Dermatophilus congolensis]MBO3134606.1 L-serine ammonia-lyase [Dermatophilus congolensis]MBO3136843.1 L-serine ammonia-lyase [Dermatophilus congolensis]MBO3139087.1 L-serine ammonia-lyase [Dermatophilus congolensis]